MNNLEDWYIIPLIGGLILAVLGFTTILVSLRKKERLDPLTLSYSLVGVAIFIIGYIKY